MRARLLPLAPLSLVAALGGCGSDTSSDPPGAETGSTGLGSVDLTDDLGCGYGFSVTDEDEKTLLSIHRSVDAGPLTQAVTLPDSGWDAEVRVGTDLAANWCTDVIEDPQAEVDETWEIVEGTLEFVGEVPPTDGTPADQPVRAELTGAVAQGPDGERVELADLSLSNDSWGFFAG